MGPIRMCTHGGMVRWMELVDGGYKYWPVDLTHRHSLSLSSLIQRWKVRLCRLAVATQAQIVVLRVLVAQRPISAAQVKFAARRRWISSVREEQSAVARQTAASNKNVMDAPAAARGRRAVRVPA